MRIEEDRSYIGRGELPPRTRLLAERTGFFERARHRDREDAIAELVIAADAVCHRPGQLWDEAHARLVAALARFEVKS